MIGVLENDVMDALDSLQGQATQWDIEEDMTRNNPEAGCGFTCSGTCLGNCVGSCDDGCGSSCDNDCSGSCERTCVGCCTETH